MVTAFDCGQKRAKEDVAVHIDVKPVCKPGWQGQTHRTLPNAFICIVANGRNGLVITRWFKVQRPIV